MKTIRPQIFWKKNGFEKINFEKYYFRKKEETERKEEEEKLAKLKEEKAASEAAKEKEKENSNKAEVKTEKKSDEPMETEDIGELDEADLQLPNGTHFFAKDRRFWTFSAELFRILGHILLQLNVQAHWTLRIFFSKDADIFRLFQQG